MPLYPFGGTNLAANGSAVLGSSGIGASVTGTASETMLASVMIPKNLMGSRGGLRVTSLWSYTNSANNKNCRIRWGTASGITGSIFLNQLVTTTAEVHDIRNVYCQATNVQKSYGGTPVSFGSTATAAVTMAVDTTADTWINFTGQTANTGETITLEGYTVEFLPTV